MISEDLSPIIDVLLRIYYNNSMKQKIVFIGNSIVNGFPLSRGKSFPGLIRAAVKDGKATFHADVINKGANGQTTSDITRRFDHDVLDHQPLAVFIMTGANDFIFGDATPEEAFGNLEEMARRAEETGIATVYMTPIRVDAKQASVMWMAGMGIDYDEVNQQVDGFSDMLRESGRLWVDTNIAYRQYVSDEPYHDGVHPTEEGYAYLSEVVLKWIEDHKTELGLA